MAGGELGDLEGGGEVWETVVTYCLAKPTSALSSGRGGQPAKRQDEQDTLSGLENSRGSRLHRVFICQPSCPLPTTSPQCPDLGMADLPALRSSPSFGFLYALNSAGGLLLSHLCPPAAKEERLLICCQRGSLLFTLCVILMFSHHRPVIVLLQCTGNFQQ